MQPQHQMRKRAVGEPIVPERILALPQNMKCLGDLYSVAWMEDSDIHNLQTETLHQQYELVKRTSKDNSPCGSHVMQYGDVGLSKDIIFLYMGTNPANAMDENLLRPRSKVVNQRDADLVHFWDKYGKAPEGYSRKVEAQKQFVEAMSHRMHIDYSIKLIVKLLFGIEKASEVLNAIRPAGQPLVDDWDCLKTLLRTFETHCGSISQYGMKHTCDLLQTFAMLELERNRWPRHRHKLVSALFLVRGALFTKGSAHN